MTTRRLGRYLDITTFGDAEPQILDTDTGLVNGKARKVPEPIGPGHIWNITTPGTARLDMVYGQATVFPSNRTLHQGELPPEYRSAFWQNLVAFVKEWW